MQFAIFVALIDQVRLLDTAEEQELVAWAGNALQSRNVPLAGIVITESHEGTMTAEETRDGLRGFVPDSLPVVCAPYTKEGFASLPNLLSLLHERPTAT